MKKALLTLLFVFSATIVGCGGDDAGTPEGDPAMDAPGTEMGTNTADPVAEGEGEGEGEGEETTNDPN